MPWMIWIFCSRALVSHVMFGRLWWPTAALRMAMWKPSRMVTSFWNIFVWTLFPLSFECIDAYFGPKMNDRFDFWHINKAPPWGYNFKSRPNHVSSFCYEVLQHFPIVLQCFPMIWLGHGKEAMVLTPEFNTLGAPKPVGPRAPETQTVAKGPPRSYKAFAIGMCSKQQHA